MHWGESLFKFDGLAGPDSVLSGPEVIYCAKLFRPNRIRSFCLLIIFERKNTDTRMKGLIILQMNNTLGNGKLVRLRKWITEIWVNCKPMLHMAKAKNVNI